MADFQARAGIIFRALKGNYRIELQIQPLANPALEMQASELTTAIYQSNAAIRRFAGLLGFAAPHMARIAFAGASGGSAVLADGKRVDLPLGRNGEFYYDPELLKNVRTLRFDRPPQRMRIVSR